MAAVKKEPVVVPLKLLIDEKNNRVLAAEANKDFVEILFSFLTFPMGTIIRLITSAKDEPTASVTIGCMNKLYTGIQNLSSEYWQTEHCKNMVLNPRNHLAQYCKKLKINIDDSGSEYSYTCGYQGCQFYSMYRNVRCICGRGMTTKEKQSADSSSSSNQGAAFLTGGIEFLISDDLQVRPASPAVLAELIPDLGSGDCSAMPIREMHLDVSKAQLICLLACALASESPLSDVFLAKRQAGSGIAGIQMKQLKLRTTFSSSPAAVPVKENGLSIKLKVTCVKSSKEILFGEATDEFFDFLCTFLTTPIGSMISVLQGKSGLTCMDNLYKSVVDLDHKWFCCSAKKDLLNPGIAKHHNCKTQPLISISPVSYSYSSYLINPRGRDDFAVEPSVFLVPDDLDVKPLSGASSFLLLKGLGIPFSQTEVQWVTVGTKEALTLLKAALTSPSSALTNGLGPFLQKHTP